MTNQEFNKAVDNYSDNIFRFILKSIRNEEKAKDIVQDSYEKLWINKASVSAEKVKAYLFTTAYRTMIDDIRRSKKITSMPNENLTEQHHDKQYSDLQEILHEAVMKLPTDQRSVIMMRDYEAYSYKEISEITKLSESQVKVYIYRARLFLKNYIGKIENII